MSLAIKLIVSWKVDGRVVRIDVIGTVIETLQLVPRILDSRKVSPCLVPFADALTGPLKARSCSLPSS